MEMPEKEWNPEQFSRSLEIQAEKAERYAREHVGRLKRGQGNGNARTRDQSFGQAALFEFLSDSRALTSVSSLSRELDRLERSEISVDFDGDQSAFRTGYGQAIAQVRTMLAYY
jgi:hypothetical protein